jgi:hypothetical protein
MTSTTWEAAGLADASVQPSVMPRANCNIVIVKAARLELVWAWDFVAGNFMPATKVLMAAAIGGFLVDCFLSVIIIPFLLL